MRRFATCAALLLLVAGCAVPAAVVQPGTETTFDVAVIGGTPEGVSAAVGAARQGKRVVLIEEEARLGGTMVLAGLNSVDLNRAPDGELLNGGIFAEWYRQVEGDSFDTGTAEQVFRDLVQTEPNITLWMGTKVTGVRSSSSRISGITVNRSGRSLTVRAERYIDSTEDADVAAAAGVQFTLGREDYTGRPDGQAVTLVFGLTGIDWERASAYLEGDGDPHTGATERSLWGYGDVMDRYVPVSPRIGMRGLNVGKQNDGSALVNALWIFGVDPLRAESRQEAIEVAQSELPAILAYIRRYCPGFETVELSGTASHLYVRETRHLAEALYMLTIDDVLENRDQPDAVAYGSYPVDIQASAPGEGVTIVGVPRRYAVPLRSLIPRSLENLLVASRSAGYSSLAHGSARTIPVGMAVAQAAGVAAAISIDQGVTLQALAADPTMVAAVQDALRAQGVTLAPFSEPSPLDGHPYADQIRQLRRRGLYAAGYENDYSLDRVKAMQYWAP